MAAPRRPSGTPALRRGRRVALASGLALLLLGAAIPPGAWARGVTAVPDPGGQGRLAVGITGFTAAPNPGEVGVTANLTVTTAGATGYLTYTYAGLPPYCMSANRSVLPCTPTAPGTYRIVVFVNDSTGGGANASLQWVVAPRLSVGPLNLTPPIADSYQGVQITLPSSGGVKPFTIRWTGLPDECLPNGTAYIHCYPGDARYFLITGYINDTLGVSGEAAALLDVVAPPNVTHLLAIPHNISLGQSLTFVTLSRTGSGVSTYAYSGLPPGCVSANVSFFSCTPTQNGTYVVTVIVTDQFNGAAERNVEVNISLPIIPPPRLLAFVASPAVLQLGANSTLRGIVVNGTGPWNYSYGGLPPGCASADTVALACTPTIAGAFNVTFSAQDGTGAQVTGATVLVVLGPPPVIGPSPPVQSLSPAWLWASIAAGALGGLLVGLLLGRLVYRKPSPLPQ